MMGSRANQGAASHDSRELLFCPLPQPLSSERMETDTFSPGSIHSIHGRHDDLFFSLEFDHRIVLYRKGVLQRTFPVRNRFPRGFALVGDQLFVCEPFAGELGRYTVDGDYLGSLNVTQWSGEGFSEPSDVVSLDGELFLIVDRPRHLVVVISKAGEQLERLGGALDIQLFGGKRVASDLTLLRDFSEAGEHPSRRFHYPRQVRFRNGKLWIADEHGIAVLSGSDSADARLNPGDARCYRGLAVLPSSAVFIDEISSRLVWIDSANRLVNLNRSLDEPCLGCGSCGDGLVAVCFPGRLEIHEEAALETRARDAAAGVKPPTVSTRPLADPREKVRREIGKLSGALADFNNCPEFISRSFANHVTNRSLIPDFNLLFIPSECSGQGVESLNRLHASMRDLRRAVNGWMHHCHSSDNGLHEMVSHLLGSCEEIITADQERYRIATEKSGDGQDLIALVAIGLRLHVLSVCSSLLATVSTDLKGSLLRETRHNPDHPHTRIQPFERLWEDLNADERQLVSRAGEQYLKSSLHYFNMWNPSAADRLELAVGYARLLQTLWALARNRGAVIVTQIPNSGSLRPFLTITSDKPRHSEAPPRQPSAPTAHPVRDAIAREPGGETPANVLKKLIGDGLVTTGAAVSELLLAIPYRGTCSTAETVEELLISGDDAATEVVPGVVITARTVLGLLREEDEVLPLLGPARRTRFLMVPGGFSDRDLAAMRLMALIHGAPQPYQPGVVRLARSTVFNPRLSQSFIACSDLWGMGRDPHELAVFASNVRRFGRRTSLLDRATQERVVNAIAGYGFRREALGEIERQEKGAGEHPLWVSATARVLMSAGRYEDALSVLIRQNQRFTAGKTQSAMLRSAYLLTGDVTNARAFNLHLGSLGQHPDFDRIFEAQVHLMNGDLEAAAEEISLIPGTSPALLSAGIFAWWIARYRGEVRTAANLLHEYYFLTLGDKRIAELMLRQAIDDADVDAARDTLVYLAMKGHVGPGLDGCRGILAVRRGDVTLGRKLLRSSLFRMPVGSEALQHGLEYCLSLIESPVDPEDRRFARIFGDRYPHLPLAGWISTLTNPSVEHQLPDSSAPGSSNRLTSDAQAALMQCRNYLHGRDTEKINSGAFRFPEVKAFLARHSRSSTNRLPGGVQ